MWVFDENIADTKKGLDCPLCILNGQISKYICHSWFKSVAAIWMASSRKAVGVFQVLERRRKNFQVFLLRMLLSPIFEGLIRHKVKMPLHNELGFWEKEFKESLKSKFHSGFNDGLRSPPRSSWYLVSNIQKNINENFNVKCQWNINFTRNHLIRRRKLLRSNIVCVWEREIVYYFSQK